MKRYGFLYEKIYDKQNIRLAILSASKRKKKRRVVQKALSRIDELVEHIHLDLKNKTYKPRKYTIKTIDRKSVV